jgi:hypothetical protein
MLVCATTDSMERSEKIDRDVRSEFIDHLDTNYRV